MSGRVGFGATRADYSVRAGGKGKWASEAVERLEKHRGLTVRAPRLLLEHVLARKVHAQIAAHQQMRRETQLRGDRALDQLLGDAGARPVQVLERFAPQRQGEGAARRDTD